MTVRGSPLAYRCFSYNHGRMMLMDPGPVGHTLLTMGMRASRWAQLSERDEPAPFRYHTTQMEETMLKVNEGDTTSARLLFDHSARSGTRNDNRELVRATPSLDTGVGTVAVHRCCGDPERGSCNKIPSFEHESGVCGAFGHRDVTSSTRCRGADRQHEGCSATHWHRAFHGEYDRRIARVFAHNHSQGERPSRPWAPRAPRPNFCVAKCACVQRNRAGSLPFAQCEHCVR
jgi:hypothetical protein